MLPENFAVEVNVMRCQDYFYETNFTVMKNQKRPDVQNRFCP